MGIQNCQHFNNKLLMREIADYYNTDIKIYTHGKDAIHIT
jgi:hypothetical protein